MVAVPVPQGGSSPAPPRNAPDGPFRVRIRGQRANPLYGAGGGGGPGAGAATRWERMQLLGGEPCTLSWVRARAKCGPRAGPGVPWAARCHGARWSAQSLCLVGV